MWCAQWRIDMAATPLWHHGTLACYLSVAGSHLAITKPHTYYLLLSHSLQESGNLPYSNNRPGWCHNGVAVMRNPGLSFIEWAAYQAKDWPKDPQTPSPWFWALNQTLIATSRTTPPTHLLYLTCCYWVLRGPRVGWRLPLVPAYCWTPRRSPSQPPLEAFRPPHPWKAEKKFEFYEVAILRQKWQN